MDKMQHAMKKNILFVNPGPSYNAHSELYQNQFHYLSTGYQGYIFTTGSKKETFPIGEFTFISMIHGSGILCSVHFLFFCIWEALRLLRQGNRIDLVVTYDPLKTGLIGLVVSWIHGAKFAPEVNGVYTSPAEYLDAPAGWKTAAKKKIYPLIIRFVLQHADGIKLLFKTQIAPFQGVLSGKIVRSFPCYVPVEDFRNIREDKEVLFVGFPYWRKGVDILIRAFKKIASKHPEWKLKILGWFPDMTELNAAMNGHPQIYHHKPVHYREMIEHIGTCGILVLPSRSEAMGRVLVEAMAAGKPRVGSDVDGIPTVIEHGVDGLLFESENVEELAEKLDALISDPELRRLLGSAGAARAGKEFGKEAYLRTLDAFYREVLDMN